MILFINKNFKDRENEIFCLYVGYKMIKKSKELITIKLRKTVTVRRKEEFVIGRKQEEGSGVLAELFLDLTGDYTTICFVIIL